MTSIERRALYHLLRMNWLNEPALRVESWQVEDYRLLSLPQLFEKLQHHDIHLDRTSFVAYADECDSPEELTDHLTADQHLKPDQEDRIYLIVFEIWRRLMKEKPSLSIVCNELDHQIYLFDHNLLDNPLPLQDALIHFSEMLNANVDQGISPNEVIQLISNHCANDVETFLYDFITEQIEEGNETYAQELLDDFDPYFADNKWFKLLRMRLFGYINGQTAQRLAEQIIEEYLDEHDLEFNLELLDVLAAMKNQTSFCVLIQSTLPLIKTEENFQDLLLIAVDYFQGIGKISQSNALKIIQDKRHQIPLDKPLKEDDTDWKRIHLFFEGGNSF